MSISANWEIKFSKSFPRNSIPRHKGNFEIERGNKNKQKEEEKNLFSYFRVRLTLGLTNLRENEHSCSNTNTWTNDKQSATRIGINSHTRHIYKIRSHIAELYVSWFDFVVRATMLTMKEAVSASRTAVKFNHQCISLYRCIVVIIVVTQAPHSIITGCYSSAEAVVVCSFYTNGRWVCVLIFTFIRHLVSYLVYFSWRKHNKTWIYL